MKKTPTIYVCNCLFDARLISLQNDNTFEEFKTKCSSGLHACGNKLWIHKNYVKN